MTRATRTAPWAALWGGVAALALGACRCADDGAVRERAEDDRPATAICNETLSETTADNIAMSFDLVVPVKRWFELSPASLTEEIRKLDLTVKMPPTARLKNANMEYVPVEIATDKGTVRTGFTLTAPGGWASGQPERESTEGADKGRPVLQGAIARFDVSAKTRPGPEDDNEVRAAWFVAAALARLGDGVVVDPQEENEPISTSHLNDTLADEAGSLDPGASAWEFYPYELFLAVEEGERDKVAKLLDADPRALNARDASGNTPLMLAVLHGNADVTRDLVARGADLCANNRYHASVVDFAIKAGEVRLLRELIARGADPTRVALFAASSGDVPGLMVLLNAGCPVEAATASGWTLLLLAISEGHFELAKRLVDRGARVTAENEDGVTALMLAASAGHLATVEMLLARGADLTHQAADGSTALDRASQHGHPEVVRLLKQRLGRTP
ncbi:MAG: ankyrin repeat domain-containing protein [Deltaproteobacteria bacterium]|nr:ankyrin repeat domain-containing protein [Deltaproteobacteria bacterium]